MEEDTKTWDKVNIDRQSDLKNWVDILKEIVNDKKILEMFAYANNHYALCRRRHTRIMPGPRIMPNPLMSSTQFPMQSCLSIFPRTLLLD